MEVNRDTLLQYADWYKDGKLTREEYQDRFSMIAENVRIKHVEKEQENTRENWIFGGIGLVVGVLVGMFIGGKT